MASNKDTQPRSRARPLADADLDELHGGAHAFAIATAGNPMAKLNLSTSTATQTATRTATVFATGVDATIIPPITKNR